jgi:hypothetical protein
MTNVKGWCVVCEAINNMSGGTIGLAANGAVAAADCERTLLPLVHFSTA